MLGGVGTVNVETDEEGAGTSVFVLNTDSFKTKAVMWPRTGLCTDSHTYN